MRHGITIEYDKLLMYEVARYEQVPFRFLLSDGSTFDVLAPEDTSGLRQAVLDRLTADGRDVVGIEGVARLADTGGATPA